MARCPVQAWSNMVKYHYVQQPIYFRIILKVTWNELTYTDKVNQKSWLEGDSNWHLWVIGPLPYQLSYRINWKQYACFIQFKFTRDSHDNLTLGIHEDVQCFHSISESSSWEHEQNISYFALKLDKTSIRFSVNSISQLLEQRSDKPEIRVWIAL